VATLNAAYDVADIVVASYTIVDNNPGDDNDGFADTNELVNMVLTLRNISDFDVENVTARLTTQSPNISCVNDPTREVRPNQRPAERRQLGAPAGNDPIQFTVANVNRAAVSDILQAQFTSP
jgi:hypothetical protein